MDSQLRKCVYSDTLLPALEAEDQIFLLRIADSYRFDFDQIQHLATTARDLEMWRETPLVALWEDWESEIPGSLEERKHGLLEKLDFHLELLRTQAKIYPTDPLRGLPHGKATLVRRPTPGKVFTLCPYFSKDANCCGLHSLEAASGCAIGCSFCSVSASTGNRVEFSADLADRLTAIELEPDRFYHVSAGQSSDSLAWGNRHGILDALFDFARRHPAIQLELRSKSDRIDYLRRHEIPDNIICTWAVNTDTIIRNEEHGSASLHGRLNAAREVADMGTRVGFRIDPIIHYQSWREDYISLIGKTMALFSPEEVDFVSMGAAWFTRSVVREIRHRGGESKALQMPMVEDPQGKLTYPQATRIELYSTLHTALQPWHNRLFVFLCMETIPVWQAVLGECVSVSEELERIFVRRRRSG